MHDEYIVSPVDHLQSKSKDTRHKMWNKQLTLDDNTVLYNVTARHLTS